MPLSSLTFTMYSRRDYERTNPSLRFHHTPVFLGEFHETGAMTAQLNHAHRLCEASNRVTRIASPQCRP